MCYEDSYVERAITVVDTELVDAATNTFRWDLTGEYNGLYIIVVQIGNVLNFFESTEEPLSASWLGDALLDGDQTINPYSLTQVNSSLVVATGDSIRTVTYDEEAVSLFLVEEVTLEVRDFFGVEDVDQISEDHIDRGNEVSFRPPYSDTAPPGLQDKWITGSHVYNLFNQGWPTEKSWCFNNGTKAKRYPIEVCANENGFYPSNADVYPEFVISVTDKDPKEIKAYTPEVMEEGELRNYASAKGRYILELLSRGKRRQEVYKQPSSGGDIEFTALQDITPNSASVVAEFAGRVFYAGFSGKVTDGDDKSPRLNNYVAFSQLVSYRQQASQCYQAADPTSSEDSEVVATDGGIIRISEATNITGMASVGNSLLIFAENGVWQIIGGSDFGFSAENYQVVKITERGCVSPQSIVNIGESIMYWASDGIYLCESSESGFFVARDLTGTTIKTFYNGISSKQSSFGAYDTFENVVSWTYGDGDELSYKPSFQAWYVNKIASTNLKIRGSVEVSPFVGGKLIETITVEGVTVTVDAEDVVVTTGIKLDKKTETKYLTIRPDNNTFTFSSYNATNFVDWECVSDFGEDAYAFMRGAHFTGGAGNLAKQSPYITFHFNKTEEGYDSEYEPINPSSCLVQASWDWSNSDNSNKQGREFQAYRFRRHYMPTDNTDEFNNGYETVVSKSKVRGRGKALSVLIKTEPLKNCQLIGWEQEVTINES
jgi:hypothetical protein